MSQCTACAGRGWGVRHGRVRRCDVCELFPFDEDARDAAQGTLAAFSLPPRPLAKPSEGGAVRCPWCGHLPSSEDELFLHSEAEDLYTKVRFGLDPAAGAVVLLGREEPLALNQSDSFLRCPECLRTFELHDEFRHIYVDD